MNELESTILFITSYFVMWFVSIYIHEAGHYLTAKLFKMDIKGFRIQKILNIIPIPTAVTVSYKDKDLENRKSLHVKYILTVINGILAGSVPVIVYMSYQNSLIFNLLVGGIYLYICSGDLTMLWGFLKGDRPYEQNITVNIPESQGECESIYPNCKTCGYFMEKECKGDKEMFSSIYKPTDLERLRKIFKEKYGDEV